MNAVILASALAAQIYNGLLIPAMGPIANAMTTRGQHVQVLWHDAEGSQTACPEYLLGHSMGGNAALRQAARCAAAHRPPRAVVTIDPARIAAVCPRGVKCVNYYNPTHPIGGQYVTGATNIVVTGTDHVGMPNNPKIFRGTLALTH